MLHPVGHPAPDDDEVVENDRRRCLVEFVAGDRIGEVFRNDDMPVVAKRADWLAGLRVDDVDAVSGATLTTRATTAAVRRALSYYKVFFGS
ncbi:MAG TPA: FMN-binding protein [Acidobacteria bacterium]|nr:FMN-binding protein [Acidobacteriota bacterium]